MKLYSKTTLIIFASLLAITFASCSSLTKASPIIISSPANANVSKADNKAIPIIKLPPQFKDLTTTNKIFINGTPISLQEGDYGKELSEKDLKKIERTSEYIITFSEDEKWVKLKEGGEDITRTGIVKNMTVTKAFLKEAKQSLQSFLKEDNYYNLNLWNSIVEPNIFKKESSTTDPNARYYVEYVTLAGPPKEKLDALKISAQSLSKDDQAIIMVLSPIDDTKLRFNYKFTDTANTQVYTSTKGAEVALKFSKLVPAEDSKNPPKFEWNLEKVVS